MAIQEYTDSEHEYAPGLSMDPEVVAAWQFEDEKEYREQLATSYPQDAKALFAQWWLRRFA